MIVRWSSRSLRNFEFDVLAGWSFQREIGERQQTIYERHANNMRQRDKGDAGWDGRGKMSVERDRWIAVATVRTGKVDRDGMICGLLDAG